MSTLPVLIIGAGLSGLALAHGLKQHKIPFKIFERDASPAFRAQGYRIRIQDFYIKQLLPPDLWAEFENCCGTVGAGMNQIDALTGKGAKIERGPPGPSPGGPNPPGPGRRFAPRPLMTEGNTLNVDRVVLRNAMMEGMVADGLVQFAKKFVKYEKLDDGVVVHFEDGTSAKGVLLVGADGARSLVRKQLVPDFQVLDTEIRAIFGKTVITEEMSRRVPDESVRGMSIVSDARDPERPIKLFCDPMFFTNRNHTKVELPDDYLYWVLCLRSDKLKLKDNHFMTLTKEEAFQETLQLTHDWDSTCQEIVSRQVVDATSTLVFTTSHPTLEPWTTNTRVTLMGDASHPMTPVGGIGANAAFRDATLLLTAIVNGNSLEDLERYEEAVREKSREFLAASVNGAGHMFGMKPIAELKPWS